MKERTITLSGLSKSYAVTGWRVGWAIGAPKLTSLIRKVHDYATVCAPAPFQEAGCVALGLPDSYYVQMREKYSQRRKILLEILTKAGFSFMSPQGAYYVMADASQLGWKNDWDLVNFLARRAGVITVPGSSFYSGKRKMAKIRFNFAKKEKTLRQAGKRLLAGKLTGF
jgi:aminotransferase